ncbi:MAG: hypothetical protein ABR549_04280 [Mycobacteriales bacterium]
MRRALALTAAAVLTLAAGRGAASPVVAVVPAVPGTAQLSVNVRHIGTIPIEGIGVSLRLIRMGDQIRAFVSGAAGLSIYDATNPWQPRLLGHLPMYNWENEAIAVSPDGKTAYLTEFDGELYLHVVDVSNPLAPRIVGSLVPGGAHTVECADTACRYLFGSEGQTYDVRDHAHPVELPREQGWGHLVDAGPGHNLHRDAQGVWVADTSPLTVFALQPDPLHLKVLTRGTVTLNTQYQHNNIRPRAGQWRPRKAGDPGKAPLRDGELLLGEGETNFEPHCNGTSGAFSTWSMANFDRGAQLQQLHTLRPVRNGVGGGDPAVNALGCSGHWFSQKDASNGAILVAAAWYEHGTRFLEVDPRTGRISQVGYFQPNRGSTSSAYWVPGTDVVWSVDYHSGIDILEFDQSPEKVPSVDEVELSWLARLDTDPFSEAVRRLCIAGAGATRQQHARLHDLRP